ncbi:MAG: hypothetical protein ACJ71D_09035, partial [Nitrososphaera sp.]
AVSSHPSSEAMAPSIFVFEMIFQPEEKDSKPPTIAATAAADLTMMKGIQNHRSWVQIPPGPFLSVLEIRYYFEIVFGDCRTKILYTLSFYREQPKNACSLQCIAFLLKKYYCCYAKNG